MIRILTAKAKEIAAKALLRAAEESRLTANTIVPDGRFTQLSEKTAGEHKERLLELASEQEKMAALFSDRADIALTLTLNEARVILKLWRHWPECDRSLPMDGGESAAWINLVEAARSRIALDERESAERFPHGV